MALPRPSFDAITGMPWIHERPLFVLKPPMPATIATCQRIFSLLNRSHCRPPVEERASRAKRKQLLTSTLMLELTQRAGDKLLMVHVEPAAADSSTPPSAGERTCAGNSIGPRCHD